MSHCDQFQARYSYYVLKINKKCQEKGKNIYCSVIIELWSNKIEKDTRD